jgi:hypothetical protein
VDLLFLVDAFGSVLGDANYDPACDFNSDDSVDVVDLLMLVDNFGLQPGLDLPHEIALVEVMELAANPLGR